RTGPGVSSSDWSRTLPHGEQRRGSHDRHGPSAFCESSIVQAEITAATAVRAIEACFFDLLRCGDRQHDTAISAQVTDATFAKHGCRRTCDSRLPTQRCDSQPLVLLPSRCHLCSGAPQPVARGLLRLDSTFTAKLFDIVPECAALLPRNRFDRRFAPPRLTPACAASGWGRHSCRVCLGQNRAKEDVALQSRRKRRALPARVRYN